MAVAPVPQWLFIGKAKLHIRLHPRLLHGAPHFRQHTLGSACVGSHQAACAQFDTTKIADHNHQHIAHILVLDHVQNGLTCGTRGFTIIVHGGLCGRAGPAYLVPPANVPGIRKVGMGTGHVLAHLIPAAYRVHAGNETAFFHFRFPLKVSGRNRVIFTHDALSAGNRMFTSSPPPGWFRAVIVPPWAATMSRAIASPRPQPLPPRDLSARKNGSNRCCSSSSGAPGPSSAIAT